MNEKMVKDAYEKAVANKNEKKSVKTTFRR